MAKSRNRRKEKRAAERAAVASVPPVVAASSTASASLVSKSAVPAGGAGGPPPSAASAASAAAVSNSPNELRAVAVTTKRRVLPANSRSVRTTLKAGKGAGTYGRVNIERLSNSSLVATKYPLSVAALQDNSNEIATLKYLEGLPHVAQFLGTSSVNAAGAVCAAFPCILMESAKESLHERSLYTDWETTLKAVIGVLQGYNVLHSSHIVHRDTKHANMLMSMTNEVYITDFGAARYTTPLISPCQDGYTGTIWFASPEVLLKQVLGGKTYSYEWWFAHDAWAVGVSLYYIVTGQYIFQASNAIDVVKSIYLRKGRPTGKDGEMVELDEDYAHANPMNLMAETIEYYVTTGGIAPQAGETLAMMEARLEIQNPAAITSRVIAKCPYQTNPEQLRVVAMVIDRLLDYNPETRLTIRGALKLLAKHRIIGTEDLAFSSGKTLFHQYQILPRRTPVTARSITRVDVHQLFQWMATIDWEDYENSPATQDIVLDRALLYFLAAFQKIESVITDRNYVAYGLMCYVIASQLFANVGKLSIAAAAELQQDPKHSDGSLYKMLKTIILAEIDFFGTTFLDELLLKLPPPLHPRAIKLNLICHTNTLYDDFLRTGVSPPQIIEFLVQIVKKPDMNTPEAISKAFEAFTETL